MEKPRPGRGTSPDRGGDAERRPETAGNPADLESPPAERAVASGQTYADSVMATIREPLLVLDADLRVESANRAYYRTFNVTPAETLGTFVHEVGNRQWDVPELRRLLEEVLSRNQSIEDFLVEGDFRHIGRRSMLLNATRMHGSDAAPGRIVVAIDDVTERMDIEERLRTSEQRFSRFMQHLPGLAWIKDAAGRYVYANDAAQKAFRVTHADLYGRSDHELFPEETASRFVANDRRALAESSMQAIEFLEDEAGTLRQSIVAKFSIPGADTDDVLVGGVAIDITDLKEAEDALRESEARYRSLFASIDAGFCVIERVDAPVDAPLDFRYVEANPAFAAQAGVSCIVGTTMRQSFPGDPEAWCRIFDDVLRTGEPIRFEHALASQGRVLELYALRIDHQSHRRVAVFFRDITPRKRAEQAQARLAAIVASSDDAIVSKNLEGVITSWNAGAERLFGYSTNEAVGQSITLVIPPDRLDEEDEILERIRLGDAVEHFDTVRRCKNGTIVDVSVAVSPILDNEGVVVGASKIARDITHRKRAEEALRDSDRRKNEFLAMLAHELRNPLAPILASIGILRQASAVAEGERPGHRPASEGSIGSHERAAGVAHALDVLQRQVTHVVRLVDDLLDAGRISRGKIELRTERVELSSVVHHVVEATRPLAALRDQELSVSLPDAPVYLDGDPTRLGQVVGNLLSNACKFTQRGGRIWLIVEHEDSSAAGHSAVLPPHIVIRVRDTGIGIATNQLERIFDMFTQLDTSLERSLAGLGIGLTLVKTLTEMHGGTVEARSAGAGQGSEFVVRLPLAAPTTVPAHGPSETTTAGTGPLRILIVDDNRDSADMLGMVLQLAGHETFGVHDGMAAVDAAAALDPDVVLMDIGLPVLNGYEAARRIRAQPQRRRRPILVAVTGWGQDEDRRRSAEAGFDAHVVKPVDEAMLNKLLAELRAAIRVQS